MATDEEKIWKNWHGRLTRAIDGDYIDRQHTLERVTEIVAERKDLAMLVVRLSRRAPVGDPVVEKAIDYLKRKGLLGSILRETNTMQAKSKDKT